MEFHSALKKLASEYEFLQIRCDKLYAENTSLKQFEGSCEVDKKCLSPHHKRAHPVSSAVRDQPVVIPGSKLDPASGDLDIQEPVEDLEAEVDRGKSTASLGSGPQPTELSRSRDGDSSAMAEGTSFSTSLDAREFRLRPRFDLSEQELRVLQGMHDSRKDTVDTMHSSGVSIKKEEDHGIVRFMMHPQSRLRLAWDFAGILVLSLDLIVTPLFVIIPVTSLLRVLSVLVTLFWTFDIVMSFRTGVYSHGVLIMKTRSVARHYTSSWLFYDVIVVLPDWLTFVWDWPEVRNTFSSARVLRILRFLRIMRLIKLKRLFRDVAAVISKMAVLQACRVFVLLAVVLVVCHFFACFWCAFGDGIDSWAAAMGVQEESLGIRYSLSLQWTVAQLQGSTNIQPMTQRECIFAVGFSLVAFVCTISLISLGMQMLSFRMLVAKDIVAQRLVLRSFVKRHRLTAEIAERVKNFLEDEAIVRQVKADEQALLALLPVSLLRTVMLDMHGETIVRHDFFKLILRRQPGFLRHLCADAFSHMYPRPGDSLFEFGDSCTVMRFIASGRVQYLHQNYLSEYKRVTFSKRHMWNTHDDLSLALTLNRSSVSTEQPEIMPTSTKAKVLDPGNWLSEASVWTVWEHHGQAMVLTGGCVLNLDVELYGDVVMLYQEVRWLSVLYGRQFISYLNSIYTTRSDIFDPPSVEDWHTLERMTVVNVVRLPFEDSLPPHISRSICNICVRLAQKVAECGLDEGRSHHGFTIILGDEKRLARYGESDFNPFRGHNLYVVNEGVPEEKTLEILRRNAFHADGAIVVDGTSGRVVASGWFVSDIHKGIGSGGARSRAARAIAQEAGNCYVIKCSEDSTGMLTLILGCDEVQFNGTLA